MTNHSPSPPDFRLVVIAAPKQIDTPSTAYLHDAKSLTKDNAQYESGNTRPRVMGQGPPHQPTLDRLHDYVRHITEHFT